MFTHLIAKQENGVPDLNRDFSLAWACKEGQEPFSTRKRQIHPGASEISQMLGHVRKLYPDEVGEHVLIHS